MPGLGIGSRSRYRISDSETRVGIRLGVLGLICACLTAGCDSREPPIVELRGSIMGTFYTVKTPRLPEGLELSTLETSVHERLEAVNGAMSTYLPDSEVSRFSRHEGTDWFPVSPDTARVVEAAVRVGKLSDGAFDITVAPLVDLWGFGPAGPRTDLPADAEITTALGAVGLDKIDVRSDPPALRKRDPATRIDLSAIAKGFAVDAVGRHLESLGIDSYMVEIGGEVRTRGVKASGAPWTIGIVAPVADRFAVRKKTVHLRDRSMATSGDYRNFFERDGKRYSHTIDPGTGRPVTHTLASVSVIASSCMEADALATALLVLGPEAGYRLASERNLAALFITRGPEGKLSERRTSAMEALLETGR